MNAASPRPPRLLLVPTLALLVVGLATASLSGCSHASLHAGALSSHPPLAQGGVQNDATNAIALPYDIPYGGEAQGEYLQGYLKGYIDSSASYYLIDYLIDAVGIRVGSERTGPYWDGYFRGKLEGRFTISKKLRE